MICNTNTWVSNGKLLLTGEYLVMEGALSLALPLNRGQSLSSKSNNNKLLSWTANKPGGLWFTAKFSLPKPEIVTTDNPELANRLKNILIATREMSVNFLNDNTGYDVITNLNFNPEFGFGTSSTLIANIAKWANVNPYELLARTFGGSGYDIACANRHNPIFFQRLADNINVSDTNFNPVFKDNIYFVHLGKKQNSAREIYNFKRNCKYTSLDIESISEITKKLTTTSELAEFEELLSEHESIMAKILNLPTAKSLYFNDYKGVVKSLGAWGGDFVLVTSNITESKVRSKMMNKGFNTVFSYKSLIRVR